MGYGRHNEDADAFFADLASEVPLRQLDPETMDQLRFHCIQELRQRKKQNQTSLESTVRWSWLFLEPALGFTLLVLYLTWMLEESVTLYGTGLVW